MATVDREQCRGSAATQAFYARDWAQRLPAYIELTKLRLVGMVLTTCSMGTLLAGGTKAWFSSFYALLGSGLLAAGACALNQYLERDTDALMKRTQGRPLPSRRISACSALLFGAILLLGGIAVLFYQVNPMTTLLGLCSAGIYLCLYIPIKRLSWLCTPLGAVAGAIPPLMGWTAVSGNLQHGSWLLFSILFFWQHVHFYAIAHIYKEDYRQGGFKMLPVVDSTGNRTLTQMVLAAVALLIVSAVAILQGIGPVFGWGSLVAGGMLLMTVLAFWRSPSEASAYWIMIASIFYLPLLFGMLVADQL